MNKNNERSRDENLEESDLDTENLNRGSRTASLPPNRAIRFAIPTEDPGKGSEHLLKELQKLAAIQNKRNVREAVAAQSEESEDEQDAEAAQREEQQAKAERKKRQEQERAERKPEQQKRIESNYDKNTRNNGGEVHSDSEVEFSPRREMFKETQQFVAEIRRRDQIVHDRYPVLGPRTASEGEVILSSTAADSNPFPQNWSSELTHPGKNTSSEKESESSEEETESSMQETENSQEEVIGTDDLHEEESNTDSQLGSLLGSPLGSPRSPRQTSNHTTTNATSLSTSVKLGLSAFNNYDGYEEKSTPRSDAAQAGSSTTSGETSGKEEKSNNHAITPDPEEKNFYTRNVGVASAILFFTLPVCLVPGGAVFWLGLLGNWRFRIRLEKTCPMTTERWFLWPPFIEKDDDGYAPGTGPTASTIPQQ